MVAKRLQTVVSMLTHVCAWGKKVFEKRIKITYDYYPDICSMALIGLYNLDQPTWLTASHAQPQ